MPSGKIERKIRILLLVSSLGIFGCYSFSNWLTYTFGELADVLLPPEQAPVASDPAPDSGPGPDPMEFIMDAWDLLPNTGPALPETAGQEDANPPDSGSSSDPSGNVAACDALPYVKVEVGDRFVTSDNSACYQDMTITNTHPDKTLWVIGHEGLSSEGKVLGEFQDFLPGEQGDELWSAYNRPATNFAGSYSQVDWYVAVFHTPECMWIIEEYVQSDFHSSRIVELPSLGLAVQYANVPSCIP